jgi:hypothetical protein
MKKFLVLALVFTLPGCHGTPRVQQPIVTTDTVRTPEAGPLVDESTAPPPTIEVPNPGENETPPCIAVDTATKPAPKRHARTARVAPPPPEPTPAPAAEPEPSVKPVANTSQSVLGTKVYGQKGEDLGRVVDILADAQGQVRLAIIESGGFLGVGNRRIAVDWSLLKFHPNGQEEYLRLDVSRRKLQSTPEYKDNGRPLALMAPNDAAPPAPPPAPKQ